MVQKLIERSPRKPFFPSLRLKGHFPKSSWPWPRPRRLPMPGTPFHRRSRAFPPAGPQLGISLSLEAKSATSLETSCRILRRFAGFSDSLSNKNEYLSLLLRYYKRTTHKKLEHSIQMWKTVSEHVTNYESDRYLRNHSRSTPSSVEYEE